MAVRGLSGLCALSWLIVAAACASAPSGPPPTLTCPAPIQTVSPDNNPVVVTFAAPVTSGTPSVTSTCKPASGSQFAVGTTAVTCTATVSGPPLSCSFNVTVSPPPHLEKTRVLAFGDSITFGADSLCNGLTALRWTPDEWFRSWQGMAAVAAPYPSVLERMLKERYTAQLPTVFNAGLSGEKVTDTATRQRFTRALNERNPEIVLLQEGINDLHEGITRITDPLRAMSLEARGRGMQVFLGTLLPERPNGCRAFAVPPRNESDFIRPTNDSIRSMAAAENIDLIDLYPLFESHLNEYIGQDGLHPTEIGYSAIAQSFFDAIKQKFEKTQSARFPAPTRF